MYEPIRKTVIDSGLWSEGTVTNHHFILSPSVFEVTLDKAQELEKIAQALHDCLADLGRLAAIAFNSKISHGPAWGMIAKIMHTGVPAIYHDIMLINPGRVPSICKVDFMESFDGALRIAEIDGHNKHGLGYSTLAARMRRVVQPGAKAFPGVAKDLAAEIKRRKENKAVLLYADQERFYLPEFRIIQAELAGLGIDLLIIAESEATNGNGKILTDFKLFVDLPFLFHNQELSLALADRYRNQEIDFLIPPKPFLGSKAVLALLANDLENEELDAILKSQIPARSLTLLRGYIPKTYLVHKRLAEKYWLNLCNGTRFVLKESISSGMKGTIFSDDSHFQAAMQKACGSYYRFILQEEVENCPRTFQYFSPGGKLETAQWFMRITVHFCLRQVSDIVITARQDKKVHGAIDCLQLGSVIT